MPVKVVFVGNPFVGDDGLGPVLYDELKDNLKLKNLQLMEISVAGLDLISCVEPNDKLIIVDVVHSSKNIGEVSVFREKDIPKSKSVVSAHDFGVEQAIGLLRLCYPDLQPIIIIGINVNVSMQGPALSTEIMKRIPKIKNDVLNCIIKEAKQDVLRSASANN